MGFIFIFGFYVEEKSKCEKSVRKILGCKEKHISSGADGGELGFWLIRQKTPKEKLV